MKRIAPSISLRAGIALALCTSFIIYPLQRLSTAKAATAHAVADLKSESQYRNEASRYDAAIRAVSGIATMKLETGEDLKKALAILDRERPNLKVHRSKLIVLALSDSVYTGAVKKEIPDRQAADAFARELKADRKAVLRLNGAELLVTRMRQSVEADSATLRRMGERLKQAAEKIRKSQGRTLPDDEATSGFRLIRAGFSEAAQPFAGPDPPVRAPQGGPLEIAMLALAVAAAVMMVSYVGASLITNIVTEEGRDAVAECHERNDDLLKKCQDDAAVFGSGLNPFYLAALAFCASEWLVRAANCLLAS